jgi:hypothetical protein
MQLQSAAWRSLPLWVAALWSMSLTTLGVFVVPMLFANLSSPAIAGNMAARLFSMQTAISTGCAVLLLILFRWETAGVRPTVARTVTLFVLAGAVLALLVEFGVSPRITARENLALWHSVGSAMYLVQWICALITFGKLANAAHR